MTGDDHGNGGTDGRFDSTRQTSPAGCSVADWECVREHLVHLRRTPPLTDAEAAAYQAEGFEIGAAHQHRLHQLDLDAQLESFFSRPARGMEGQVSQPLVADHATAPTASRGATGRRSRRSSCENGIRLDTNYYYWPPAWVQDRPGMFTGSGMPMRFADADGSMIDVYQAATQMTDESGQTEPFNIDTLLDNALGPEGYYGVFTANMHTDDASSPGSDAIVGLGASRAACRSSPHARCSSGSTAATGPRSTRCPGAATPRLHVDVAAGANGLRANGADELEQWARSPGSSVTARRSRRRCRRSRASSTRSSTPKAGSYEATYAVDDTAPAISNVADAVHSDGSATITWDTDEASDSRVDYGTDPDNLSSNQTSSSLVTSHSVTLNGLDPNRPTTTG